jgi:hypothetical protein
MELVHFTVTNDVGETVDYAGLWQRLNLLLIVVDDSPSAAEYAAAIRSNMADLTAYDTACVITRDAVAGTGRPGALIADRWGEVHFSISSATVDGLPGPAQLVEWLRYVQMQCPECQGEAK